MFDLLCNVLLLIFWVRLFTRRRESTYYNPYIAWMNQVSRTVLNRIRASWPALPQEQAAALVFVLLLVVQAVVRQTILTPAPRFGLEPFPQPFPPDAGFAGQLVFSAASFAGMMFYLGTAYLWLARQRSRSDSLSQCLRFIVWPLPQWHPPRRWIAVLVLGLSVSAVLALMSLAAFPETGWTSMAWFRVFLRIVLNTAAALVDFLAIVQLLLIAVVIGSWIVLLAPSEALAELCGDAMALLLGPFRDYRLAIGPLDLTPLLAVLAVAVVHNVLMSLIEPLYHAARTAGTM